MPSISIIIVNWNGKKWLEKCFSSLQKQTYKDFEIILVDNASSDDSISYLESSFPEIIIIKSIQNLGFAGGNNLGIEQSKGKYVLLLNNDTWIEEDFLEKYMQAFMECSVDILGVTEKRYDTTSTKVISYPKIDIFGHPVYLNTKKNTTNIITDLFYTSGVCILFKKDLYLKTGGLDNDFFMYFEEIDWIWRVRLYGGKIGQLQNLFIYHAGAGSTGKGIQYNMFLWRNQNTLQMLLKNYKLHNLIWIIPVYISINIVEIIVFLLYGKFDIAFSYVQGWIYNIKIFSKILEKRKQIQENRILSDKDIMKLMYIGPGKLHHLFKFLKK